MDAGIACLLDAVIHRLRPVPIMTDRQERFALEQPRTVLMRVDVGRVLHVVAGAFQPTNEIDLPAEKLALTARSVWPVPRHLHRPRRARDGVRAVAVVSE